MPRIPWIAPDDHTTPFPDLEQALQEPNGLLAIGGPLSPQRLEQAYRCGIFPWFSDDQPVLWWSPDPRAVIYPEQLHLSRSLRRRLRRGDYAVTMDRAFRSVVEGCAGPRDGQPGTWITSTMIDAYTALFELGIGHCVEVRCGDRLVGGLYGVSLGAAFFGESMFSRATDASKVAMAWLGAQLQAWDFDFIDCQLPTPHLASMGAVEISRSYFRARLERAVSQPTRFGPWSFDVAPFARAC